MQFLDIEKYHSNGKDFQIVIYRDNNNDRLQLDAHEVMSGVRQQDVINTQYVPMNGNFNLPHNHYPSYSEFLAAIKQAIIFDAAAQAALNQPDANIFPDNNQENGKNNS